MKRHNIEVVMMEEALTFVRSTPLKVQEKIIYNYRKIEQRGYGYRTFQEARRNSNMGVPNSI